jgi:hypothetical protein
MDDLECGAENEVCHDEWRISNAVSLGWTCIARRWLDHAGGRIDLTGIPPESKTNEDCRIPGFSWTNVERVQPEGENNL